MKSAIVAVVAACSVLPLAAQDYYVKELVFPSGADSVAKIEMAGRLVPNEQQRAWQERELTAFLHFGMNTFTNREWGDGKESPELFNPDLLDTDQWVRTLKNAGFKMVILTAKHHDGFCLWPTATTKHSVASSPWRGGKGDVVADLRHSCDKYGMKLGLYLSPWDRNAECYGDSPRYNDMFVAQLTELLSNYGKIDEVWFDGACGEGPNGRKQEYDWLRFRDTMRRLQPEAVLAITGDDVRWVGNEGGRGRETEWSVTPLVPKVYADADSVNASLGINEMSPLIGSREMIVKADRLYWWPSEVDVSIRPGWFYHENERPHSLKHLAEIYLQSVGRNSVLLLNVPPDNHGRIAAPDVKRLHDLHRWIAVNFRDNLLNDPEAEINTVILEEDISRGQRVEEFEILAYNGGQSKSVVSGTTVGKKRIQTFDPVKADSLQLRVLSSRGEPHAAIVGAYYITMPREQLEATSEYPFIEASPMFNSVTSGDNPRYLRAWQNPQAIAGFIYTPTLDLGLGMMYRYSVYVSDNLEDWTEVPTIGEFGNIEANPIPQQVIFDKPVTAKAIRIVCEERVGKKYIPDAAEILYLAPMK